MTKTFFSYTILLIAAFTVFITCSSSHLYAQEANLDQFTASSAIPLGGAYIKTNRFTVKLFGINVPEGDTQATLHSRELLDRGIGGQPINCRIYEWKNNIPHAQCVNKNEQDLALSLLKEGTAYVDREAALAYSGILTAYNEAEHMAVTTQRGLWHSGETSAASMLDFQNLRPDLKQNLFILLAIISLGPLFGLVIMSFVMYGGFGRLINMQKQQFARSNKDSKEMREREKSVLSSSLEGEIQSNRAKVEAFLTIYKEMLRDLRNPNKNPKYKQTGDIIHDKASLSRMVYDANLDKIDLLGPSLAGLLSQLYSEIESNPKYQTLDPEVPLEEAERRVERIVLSAEKSIPLMDKLITGLKVINRGKTSPKV